MRVCSSYCTNGVATECPAGRYGTATGLTSSSSCTACPSGKYSAATGATSADACTATDPGYYAAEASTAASPCGDPSLVCPGSERSAPLSVSTGFYSSGGTAVTVRGRKRGRAAASLRARCSISCG